ncbi:amidinotransferase [Amycolatopsis sp. QT-25]|uniref:amidinotransferase n=1 Tax=Amycolatopsis sp. QT-25 TaxID=3034022 RepID=UPI0023EADC01|nr:amidinotransferase [Amycolatopsis sp. QT-25]WET76259.1 amidinotransferase [Amycolatopsis sp. QT-25]
MSLTEPSRAVISSYTEWDPLEEVVVGRLDGGVFPTWQPSMAAVMPPGVPGLLRHRGGQNFPGEHLDIACRELDDFADMLAREGIEVRRPAVVDHSAEFATPHWRTNGGLYAAMPRDLLLVAGTTIVEAPMSWRCRYHEVHAYRELIKSYFQAGAGWLQAPQPLLTDELFRTEHGPESADYAITEFEPVFDAADFLRFGNDIVAQQSHVTNAFGIRWLDWALGDEFQVHRITVNDPHAMHIDATLAALAPGVLLVNPERYIHNDLFKDWKIIEAPEPTLPAEWPMYFCSPWVSMNVLSLDERTVVVERQEKPLIDVLTSAGFDCFPVDFRHVYSFGGSFHCVTADMRRAGGPETYLT